MSFFAAVVETPERGAELGDAELRGTSGHPSPAMGSSCSDPRTVNAAASWIDSGGCRSAQRAARSKRSAAAWFSACLRDRASASRPAGLRASASASAPGPASVSIMCLILVAATDSAHVATGQGDRRFGQGPCTCDGMVSRLASARTSTTEGGCGFEARGAHPEELRAEASRRARASAARKKPGVSQRAASGAALRGARLRPRPTDREVALGDAARPRRPGGIGRGPPIGWRRSRPTTPKDHPHGRRTVRPPRRRRRTRPDRRRQRGRRRRRRRTGQRQGRGRGGRRHRRDAAVPPRVARPSASCRSSRRSPSARCATSCSSSCRPPCCSGSSSRGCCR